MRSAWPRLPTPPPAVTAQLSPCAQQDAVSGFDIGSPEVQAQFDQLGMKPDEFMNKVWSDPELVAGMSNPKVQAALMDMQKNPMNAMKHMQDPEVSKVLMRMQQIMQPQASVPSIPDVHAADHAASPRAAVDTSCCVRRA